MPQYRYKARNLQGEELKGIMMAPEEQELHEKLRMDGKLLIDCREIKQKRVGRNIKNSELSEFCRELGTLLASGVTLVRALAIISKEEAIRPHVRKVCSNLLAMLQQGYVLSDAMEEESKAFPSLMTYMVRSAEASGNLDRVLLQMSLYYQKKHKLAAKLNNAMIYPKILMSMLIGSVLLVMTFVMPQFSELFSAMDYLPWATEFLMNFSELLIKCWPLFLGVYAVWILMWSLLMRMPGLKRQRDCLVMKVPVIGKHQKTICTARFAQTLSTLYVAGVPMVTSLQIASKTIGNTYVECQFDNALRQIRSGKSLSEVLAEVRGFHRKLADSILIGEETGSLETMLVSTSETLEYEAEVAIEKMVSYMEPIMLILMGLAVGFVMIAVIMPIYSSYNLIGG